MPENNLNDVATKNIWTPKKTKPPPLKANGP